MHEFSTVFLYRTHAEILGCKPLSGVLIHNIPHDLVCFSRFAGHMQLDLFKQPA